MSKISSLHQLAFDKNAQASIIANVAGGKIIAGNAAACQLLGYTAKSLLTRNWSSLFQTGERSFKKLLLHREAAGQGHGLVCVNQKSGTVICCEISSALFTDKEGIERTITTLADRSSSIRLQKKIDTKSKKLVADNIKVAKSKQLKIDVKKDKMIADNIIRAKKTVAVNIGLAKSKQISIDRKKDKTVAHNIVLAQEKSDRRFQLTFNSSSDVLYDIDLVKNEILLSDDYEKEFGYQIKAHMSPVGDWADHIHPDDKAAVIKDYNRMLNTDKTAWKFEYRLLRSDQSVANILSSAIILRTGQGKAYRMIGSLQDISKQTELEARLKTEIRLKKKQIAAAMSEAKDTERSDIGKELHDNVNQLLGISRLYLSMAKKGGPDSGMYLSRSSEYTLTAIEEIRKLTKGLMTDTIRHLGLVEAIHTIIRDSMEVSPLKISFSPKHFDEKTVNEKFKVNLFRIVQEHLNNILKHAHASHVEIRLDQHKGKVTLLIADNGVGFDLSRKQKGIGIENIKDRALLFDGSADFLSSPGKGCTLTVAFSNAQ